MKQVYEASDLVNAQMLKDYLVSFGIEAIVKGELLVGAIGEIPADSYPTVWIVNENDLEKAKLRIKNFESQAPDDQMYNSVWKCMDCDELIDAQFTQCWKCGSERKRPD